MDIEHMTHLSYKKSLWVAAVLSGLAVVLAAVLGRGTLNLRGAVYNEEPTGATVIVALYNDEVVIQNGPVVISHIEELRKEKETQGGRSLYSYLVELSDTSEYFVQLGWDGEKWIIADLDLLHGGGKMIHTDEQDEGTESLL